MAAKRARKTSPAAVPGATSAPDPTVVKQVSADVLSRLEADTAPPPGVTGAVVGDVGPRSAALFGGKGTGKGGLKKLVDAVIPALVKGAMIAADGQVSADEFREIAEMGYELVRKLIARRAGGEPEVPTTPTAA